ncbi:protein FAM167A [Thalassophryne amazonica]|uniref:protein FAM167A n=1 Tax=Thalassophryne amazonica TaxID=390379 RepID=UPI0014723707|nr:protein FAM167A [Thalassophryne amazonica]
MDRDSHSEDTLSTMVLENIKNRLIHAFRATAEPREDPQDSGTAVRSVSIGRSFQANEELRRAQIDGAITWLRSELLEMRSQDLQLAQTLLGLNTEIQRLRRESFGGVEVDGMIIKLVPGQNLEET